MGISDATEYLAKMLIVHYDAEDPATKLLSKIAEIRDYLKDGNLSEWETAVLSSVVDLDSLEHRSDFPLIESVWEIGRSNLYGAISESQTRDLYLAASERLKGVYRIQVKPVSEFDFARW